MTNADKVFPWPKDTVFVRYEIPFDLLRIALALDELGAYFVVDTRGRQIAMSRGSALMLSFVENEGKESNSD